MDEVSHGVLRRDREQRLRQCAKVIWFYGLSGSGKSTLAKGLEKKLWEEGFFCAVMDGDDVRSGLNKDLKFSDEDRAENIRRVAEVSKLFIQAGAIAINSFITPLNSLRESARKIIGEEDLIEIYLKCSYEVCARRDVKGLYAKAQKGEIAQFTGKDSSFEPPQNPHLIVDTEITGFEKSLKIVYDFVTPFIHGKLPS